MIRSSARARLAAEALAIIALGAALLVASVAVARALQPKPVSADAVLTRAATPVQRLLGKAVHRIFLHADVLVDDPTIIGTLNPVVDHLLAAADLNPDELSLFVIELPVANAFVAPGNAIYLTTELFVVLDSPQQLAAVISHEIGHVAEQHAAKALVRRVGLSVLAAGLGVADERIATRLLEHLVGVSFSRDAEWAADRFAMNLLLHAGLSPAHLGHALEQLGAELPDRSGIARYLDSHPDLNDRIAATHRYAWQAYAEGFIPRGGGWIDAIDWAAVRRVAVADR